MSPSTSMPRPEQVAELTQGQYLPLEPIPALALQVITETIVRAWKELSASHEAILRNGEEAEVNALLISHLNNLRDDDPCWENIASGVSRGQESISFDGRRLETRPDLSIHLTRRNFNFPLVAECKLIDRPHDKTVNLYCTQGLIRFVVGDYAWMSREAFMLAYVRDGSSIGGSLRHQLMKCQVKTPDPCATERLPIDRAYTSTDLAHSRHVRRFIYQSPTANTDPCPIDLWHLWLSTKP